MTTEPGKDLELAGAKRRSENAIQLGEVMYQSGFFSNVKNAAQAAVKIMFGDELGLEPISSMQGIHIIPPSKNREGDVPKLVLSGDVQAQLMKAHGYDWDFIQHDETVCELEIKKNGKTLKTEDGTPARVKFTYEQAKKAGLTNRSYTPWTTGYAMDMLWNRAIVRARRRYAPETTAALRSPARIIEPEDLADEPLDNQTRGRMYSVVRERGITMEQKLELTNQVKPGCASWSEDGGLTNAEGWRIIELMEQQPKPQDPDLFPALEQSVKATDKDVEGSPGASGKQTSPPKNASASPPPNEQDVDPPGPEPTASTEEEGSAPGTGPGGVPTNEEKPTAHKGEVMASDEQINRVLDLAAALGTTAPPEDKLTAAWADKMIEVWTKEYDKREGKK